MTRRYQPLMTVIRHADWRNEARYGSRIGTRGQRQRRNTASDWFHPRFLTVAGLLFIALTLGGCGSHAPLLAAIVEAVAIIPLLVFALFGDHSRIGRGGFAGLLLLIAVILLSALQLVPLAPAIWVKLPGRQLLAQAVVLLRLGIIARPMTLDQDITRATAMTLVPGAAMFVAMLHLSSPMRARLAAIVVAIAVASCLLGALQMVSTEGAPVYLYSPRSMHMPLGFFANRNHQALFLASALPLIAVLERCREGTRDGTTVLLYTVLLYGVGLLIILAGLATMSRSGAGLLVLSAVGSVAIILSGGNSAAVGARRKSRLLWGALGGVAALASLLVFAGPNLLPQLFARIDVADVDQRYIFWPDVLYALRVEWPWGSGIGTFDLAFRSIERLQALGPLYVNHAHNDYLEVAIEAGLPGIILIVAFLGWYSWLSWRAWRANPEPRTLWARAGSIIVLLILLQSATDYPLRTLALDTMFALACGLLVPRSRRDALAA